MKTLRFAVGTAAIITSLVGLSASAHAVGSKQTICNGGTMWALSTSDGASTSALNCHLVRVRVKERIGGNYYWTGYVYDDDGDVELRNAYTTVGGGHGARPNSSASWTTLTT